MAQDAINLFLNSIQFADRTTRHDMFEIEAIENGGTFTSPTRHGGWLNSHLTEINMHGIFTTGETDDEAIIHWINQARALVKMSA